jgi:hypothetical protein
MGAIKKILSSRQLPERELHNSRLFVDLSENIHIHFREFRLMFSVDEFIEFTEVMKEGAGDIKRYLKQHPEYREQEVFDGIMVAGGRKRQTTPLRSSPKPHESKYFPNRLQIELQEEKVIDSIHIHYRDYRLAMNFETFREFAEGMKEAHRNLETFLGENRYDQHAHPVRAMVKDEKWREGKITLRDRILHKSRQILGRIFKIK